MNAKEPVIGRAALCFLICCSMVTCIVFSMPTFIAEKTSRGSLWLILGIYPFMVLFICIVKRVNSLFGRLTLREIYVSAFGRAAGGAVFMFFILYTAAVSALFFNIFTEGAAQFFLKETPRLVIRVLTALVLLYCLYRGPAAVFRMNVFFVLQPVLLLLIMAAGVNDFDVKHLLPLDDFGGAHIYDSAALLFFALSGIQIILLLYRYFSAETKKGFAKLSLVTCAAVCLFHAAAFAACFMTFGYGYLIKLQYPVMELTELIENVFMNKMEFFTMLIYAFFGLAAPLNLLSAVSLNIADATDGESPAGRRLRRFMPLLLTLAVLGLGELFGDTEDAGRIMAETLPLSLLFGFGVPSAALLLGRRKKTIVRARAFLKEGDMP